MVDPELAGVPIFLEHRHGQRLQLGSMTCGSSDLFEGVQIFVTLEVEVLQSRKGAVREPATGISARVVSINATNGTSWSSSSIAWTIPLQRQDIDERITSKSRRLMYVGESVA